MLPWAPSCPEARGCLSQTHGVLGERYSGSRRRQPELFYGKIGRGASPRLPETSPIRNRGPRGLPASRVPRELGAKILPELLIVTNLGFDYQVLKQKLV